MPRHIRHISQSHRQHGAQHTSQHPTQQYANQAQLYQAQRPLPAYYAIPPSPIAESQQDQTYEAYAAASAPVPQALTETSHRPSSGAWSTDDDRQLVSARMQGLNWGQIKDTYFPNKSPNACRKRHERLLEAKGADTWDQRRFQLIAREYLSMRKEIWQGLAQRTGEKWNVVEQKCMSKGLKNLQSAARAATRRDRIETTSAAMAAAAASGAGNTGYDDDSGISGIGLTPVDDHDPYSSPAPSPSTIDVAHSFASTVTQPLYHPQMQQAHLHPAVNPYTMTAPYGGQYASHHAYSSSISSDGSLQHPFVSRRGNESA
ncbi:hypothetical protein K4F52_006192 [Lecanicillium sp. MT-2017a]|nr:hypothetical protein K4F52_006192 [Lecanicillium sp. MT-2017a]